ncbi:MAG TPA: FAD:protein FMN transferase, partial [Acidimicrobiales bacterium]|nr:FAD:protein FMN transferase [Acidimicrobiales bacterium]
SALMEEVIDLCGENFELTRGYFDPWAMPGGFDPTGLVKGWAAERALRELTERGVANALVNAGGDVCVTPGASFLVGIQHPFDAEALCGVVNVTSAVATSGIYARGAHLINPHGEPIAAVSATVVGGRLVVADALATALAVGGASVLYLLEEIEGVEGFFITPEGVMFTSSGMAFATEGATASTLNLTTS